MTWALPLAGLLAMAAALPLLAHLVARRRPVRVPFPTLRFLREVSGTTRRLTRRVHDRRLLLLRVAIIILVAVAAAGPTLVTATRLDAWRQRLHRVVVVEDAAAQGSGADVAALKAGATSALVVQGRRLAELLPGAIIDATDAAQTQRAELVVLWDGTRAALTPADLAQVPGDVGVRLHLLRGTGRGESQRTGGGPGAHAALPVSIAAAPADGEVRREILARLATLGATTMVVPVDIRWPGAEEDAGRHDAGSEFVGVPGVLDALAADARVRDAAERSRRDARDSPAVPARAVPLARLADGSPLLHGWWSGTRLMLTLHATPSSPLAVWSAVAALEALSAAATGLDAGRQFWTAAEIAAVQREPRGPSAPVPLPGGLDSRLAWTLVLALLLVEQWLRRGPAADGGTGQALPPISSTAPGRDAA